jgi:hypothetical protein
MSGNLPQKPEPIIGRIVILMLENVRGNPIISPPGTILRQGMEYKGESNPYGAVSGLCKNGKYLGVKPGEFRFIEAPDRLLLIHGVCPACFHSSKGALS